MALIKVGIANKVRLALAIMVFIVSGITIIAVNNILEFRPYLNKVVQQYLPSVDTVWQIMNLSQQMTVLSQELFISHDVNVNKLIAKDVRKTKLKYEKLFLDLNKLQLPTDKVEKLSDSYTNVTNNLIQIINFSDELTKLHWQREREYYRLNDLLTHLNQLTREVDTSQHTKSLNLWQQSANQSILIQTELMSNPANINGEYAKKNYLLYVNRLMNNFTNLSKDQSTQVELLHKQLINEYPISFTLQSEFNVLISKRETAQLQNDYLTKQLISAASEAIDYVKSEFKQIETIYIGAVNSSVLWLIVLFSCVLSLAIILYVLIQRSILKRIFILKSNMELLAQGEKVNLAIMGDDEITEMTRAIDKTSSIILKREEEAREANKTKDIFLANVGHEIRTPMTGLITTLELFKRTDLNQEQKRYIQVMEDASNTQLMLLNQLVELSGAENVDSSLNKATFNIQQVLLSVYNLFLPQANIKNLTLILDTNIKEPQWLIGDEQKIRQVLQNLIQNAIKYTPQGKITVYCHLNLDSDDVNQNLSIKITDTGDGILDNEKKKIFTAFYQIKAPNDNACKAKQGGVGLGLSICQKLIKLMDSDIYLKSTKGKGSCFYFDLFLPLSTSKNDNVFPVIFTKKLKILLVDDELLNLELVAKLLTIEGHQVVKASNGQDCLAIYQQESFDIVLLDIWLPDINGFEVLARMKEYNQSLIIAYTASLIQRNTDKYLVAGFDDVLPKPLQLNLFNELMIKLQACGKLNINDVEHKQFLKKCEESYFNYINVQKGIENCNNDNRFYQELIVKFLIQYRTLPDINSQDTVKAYCHKLTIGLNLLCVETLSILADEISDYDGDIWPNEAVLTLYIEFPILLEELDTVNGYS